jgi:hypothetical protein
VQYNTLPGQYNRNAQNFATVNQATQLTDEGLTNAIAMGMSFQIIYLFILLSIYCLLFFSHFSCPSGYVSPAQGRNVAATSAPTSLPRIATVSAGPLFRSSGSGKGGGGYGGWGGGSNGSGGGGMYIDSAVDSNREMVEDGPNYVPVSSIPGGYVGNYPRGAHFSSPFASAGRCEEKRILIPLMLFFF